MVKKLLLFLLVVAVVVLGYFQLRSYRMSFTSAEGKLAEIIRGDLTVPIEATGEILPARRIEIKAEASGEVLEIKKRPGDLVKKDEVIFVLDEAEEQRNLERAENEVRAAEARLRRAQLQLKNTRDIELVRADNSITRLQKQLELAKFQNEKSKDPKLGSSEEELLTREVALATTEVDLSQAKVARVGVMLSIEIGEQDVAAANATLESAKRTEADAKERLEKTQIRSPIDGMIGEVPRQVGEVIQGGKTTITGGTLLATVIDVSKRIVRAEVDEADIGRVFKIAPSWAQPGRDASVAAPTDWEAAAQDIEMLPVIHVDSFREEEFTGIIERINPEPRKVQEAIYYYVDVVIVSANREKLFNGMRADVTFTSERVKDALLCPEEAIFEDATGALGVRVPDDSPGADPADTKFIPCKFNRSNSVYSEVMSGLTEGMKVYTKLPVSTSSSRDKKR
ncbi:MAG: HlyD family efflux transporter periplasmic adaptor subunit [Phycisphaerales bacterium]|nr:HlyD family efflux transporter periplasmic adaptor subunit [Phycisphaerales bacterium]